MFIFDNIFEAIIVLVCCTLIAYIVHHFSGSEISIMHWMTKRKIANWKRQNRKHIDLYTEKPTECIGVNGNGHTSERYQFVGCETDGTILFIDYRIANGEKEAFLYLKFTDGRIFTLPSHPNVVRENRSRRDALSMANLRFEILVPHSKWRITYNGWLRVLKPSALINDTADAADDEFQHVVFSFFWTAASNPIAWPDNWSTDLLLRSLAGNDVAHTLDQWLSLESGFDQCGAMYGQITVDDGDDGAERNTIEVNLPGVRRVRMGNANRIGNCSEQSATTFGIGSDGIVLVLSSTITGDGIEGCFGFVRWANGDILPIERSEFYLNRLLQFKPGDQIDIKFSTKTKNYAPTLKIDEKSSIRIYGGDRQLGFVKTISALATDLNGISVNGLILCHNSLTVTESMKTFDNSFVEQPFSYPAFDSSIRYDKTKLTVRFDSSECQSEELCGGKGSSLGFLTNLTRQSQVDFEVPSGFVLTSTAFLLQLKRNNHLDEAITALENIAYHRVTGSLLEACATVGDLFKSIEIDAEIGDAIAIEFVALKGHRDASFRVAIRSSAIGEDGNESSSAGQNATYLGVGGIERVLMCIRDCWASLFTPQSVSYRLQTIQPIRTPMAVVVQTMIPSEAAGVLFTHFPLNNDPNKLLVTGNFGLGESVVSGSVDPDVFVVLRGLRNNNLTILERKLGDKAKKMAMNETDRVISAAVDHSERKKYCISDENLLHLCQIGIYLEHCYQSARDIEWAVYNNKIFLLQSRPMTSTKAFSSWELLHEFDTAIMSADDLHTFGNVGEVMPEAITPLTFSTLGPSLNRAMLSVISPEKVSPLYNALFASSHYRISINVFNAFLYFVEKSISLTNRVHGIAVFGHEFITEELHRLAVHRNGIGPRSLKLYLLYDLFSSMWRNKTIAHEGRQFMEKFRGTYHAHNLEKFPSMESLYVDLSKKIQEMDYMCEVHCCTTKTITGYEFIVFQVLAEGGEELSPEFSNDVALMLSSCKDVESAEIPILLEQIDQCIQKTGKQDEFCSIDAENGVAWLLENCHKAHELLQTFLQKHGHRAYAEFELATVTWGMRPALVIEMLQRTVTSSGDGEKRRTKATLTNDEIVAALKSPKRPRTRKIIKTFLPHCQTSVQLREQSKSGLIAYMHELRQAYRFLGRKMQQNGLLPDPDLIFYLTHQEIGRVLNEKCGEVLSKAQRRKRSFPEWKKFRFDEFQSGVMKPLDDTMPKHFTGSVQVKGTPVCEGNISGRACVVRDFGEVRKIRAGDILITHSTDIAWSPYFPILGGVVTELGGLISHGAVVAREYGLPCIVGAVNATSIINDGDAINMNAVSGVITKIEA